MIGVFRLLCGSISAIAFFNLLDFTIVSFSSLNESLYALVVSFRHTTVLYHLILLFLRNLTILSITASFPFYYSFHSSLFRNLLPVLFLFLSFFTSPLLSSSSISHLHNLLNFLVLFIPLQSYFKCRHKNRIISNRNGRCTAHNALITCSQSFSS